MDTSKKNIFEAYGDSIAGPNIIGSLLKFTKFGEWKAGQEERLIPHGSQFIADVNSVKVGWLKWVDNKIVDDRLKYLRDIADASDVEARGDLGDTDEEMWETFENGQPKDPWVLTNTMIMLDPNTEELYTFSGQSNGAIQAIGNLTRTYGSRLRAFPGQVPTVALGMTSYEHAEYGEIRKPVFAVVSGGWVDPPETLINAVSDAANARQEIEAAPPLKKIAAPAKKAAPVKKPVQKIIPPPKGKRNGPQKGVRF